MEETKKRQKGFTTTSQRTVNKQLAYLTEVYDLIQAGLPCTLTTIGRKHKCGVGTSTLLVKKGILKRTSINTYEWNGEKPTFRNVHLLLLEANDVVKEGVRKSIEKETLKQLQLAEEERLRKEEDDRIWFENNPPVSENNVNIEEKIDEVIENFNDVEKFIYDISEVKTISLSILLTLLNKGYELESIVEKSIEITKDLIRSSDNVNAV